MFDNGPRGDLLGYVFHFEWKLLWVVKVRPKIEQFARNVYTGCQN